VVGIALMRVMSEDVRRSGEGMMIVRIRRLAIGGVLAAVALLSPGSDDAHAGTYLVHACGPLSAGAFRPTTGHVSGVGASQQSHCPWDLSPSAGAGLWTGLSYKSYLRPGDSFGYLLDAPPTTSIVALQGHYAWTPGVRDVPGEETTRAVWDDVSGSRLTTLGTSSEWEAFSASGFSTGRVGVGFRCYLSSTCKPAAQLSGPTYAVDAWIGFLDLTATLHDDTAPTISVTQPPPSAWVGSGSVAVTFNANDGVGVRALQAYLDGHTIMQQRRDCYEPSTNLSTTPCSTAGPSGSFTIDISSLADGRHTLALSATDPASNAATVDLPLLVDRQAPAAPRGISLSGGDAWRSQNRFGAAWADPPAEGEAPIAEADYELCPQSNDAYDESGCHQGQLAGINSSSVDDFAVPGDGEWRLRLWLKDLAGNADSDRAATVEHLRLDSVAPVVAFEPFDAADPTRVNLAASDATSGIASAEIEARRQGEAVWRSLAVTPRGTDYVAYLDDASLPDGRYDLRARVTDAAGNERTTTLLGSGQPLQVELPVRVGTTLAVGHPARVRASKGKKPHYRTVLVSDPAADYGAPVSLEGHLSDSSGNPLANAPVNVLEQVHLPGMEWRLIASLYTDRLGRFVLRAQAGPARHLRFDYPGTATSRPGTDEVELRVRAGVTLVPGRHRLHNGQVVKFRGRLLGGFVPPEGKLVTLQALTTRGWETFANARARSGDGRWSYRYHFTGTTSTSRYAFRVVVPVDAGYPYAQGISQVAHVLVLGG
jgi:hypothetical protein